MNDKNNSNDISEKNLSQQTNVNSTSCTQLPKYNELLQQAIQFTNKIDRKISIADDFFELSEKNQIKQFGTCKKTQNTILECTTQIYKDCKTPMELQCHWWSHKLLNDIEKIYNKRAFVTYGQVWLCHQDRNECLYPVKWEDLEQGAQSINPNEHRPSIPKYHAWITLQSGQIIDFTLFSTLAKQDSAFERFYGYTNFVDISNSNSFRYVPMYFYTKE